MQSTIRKIAATCVLADALLVRPAAAQQSTEDLAAAAQNPIAAMYSLPFQNNTFFGAGPNHDKTANVLNIQPVLPFSLGEWNVISRTIAPLIYVPNIGANPGAASLGDATTSATMGGIPETFGLGDINQTLYSHPPRRPISSGASVRRSIFRRQQAR